MTGTPCIAVLAAGYVDSSAAGPATERTTERTTESSSVARTGPAPASTGFLRTHRARLPAPHVESLVGRVRVVGLEVCVVEVLAGTGPDGQTNTSEKAIGEEGW